LYVSVKPVANHDCAFWVKVVPTINQPHDAKEPKKKKNEISQHSAGKTRR
jgi:hypothetical protein